MLMGGGTIFVDVDPEDTIADCHPGNDLDRDSPRLGLGHELR